MKRIRIFGIFLLFIIFMGTSFAAEPTYKVEKIGGGGNSCNITFYSSDGKKVEGIEIKNDIFNSTGLQNSGNLTLETMKKIRSACVNKYIEQCDSCLNTEVTVYSGKFVGGYNQPVTKKLSECVTGTKPTEKSAKSEILAYNINSIKNTLKSVLQNERWTKLQFDVVSLAKTTSDGFVVYDKPNTEQDGKGLENTYNILLSSCNSYFVNDNCKLVEMGTVLTQTGLISTQTSNSNTQTIPEKNIGAEYDEDWWGAAQSFFNKNKTRNTSRCCKWHNRPT